MLYLTDRCSILHQSFQQTRLECFSGRLPLFTLCIKIPNLNIKSLNLYLTLYARYVCPLWGNPVILHTAFFVILLQAVCRIYSLHPMPVNNNINVVALEHGTALTESHSIIKGPTRDACLYMGEASPPDPPAPFFVFAISLCYRAHSFHIWQVFIIALGNFSGDTVTTFPPIQATLTFVSVPFKNGRVIND